MNLEEMKDEYLELIKTNKNYEQEMIDKIFLKHKMQLTIHCINSLSSYLDYLNGLTVEDNDYFLEKHNNKYNIKKKDQEESNSKWDDIEKVLLEDNYEEIEKLQSEHERYQNDDWKLGLKASTLKTL